MADLKRMTLLDFYQKIADHMGTDVASLLPLDSKKNIGHFTIFDLGETIQQVKKTKDMPYNRREYYKISLIRGRNQAEYADKTIEIKHNALLFATPRIPYRWTPLDEDQSGCFLVFTPEFMAKSQVGIAIDELPIHQPKGYPLFEISDEQAEEIQLIFNKIKKEVNSEYAYKYELIRTYILELFHLGQKLQPTENLPIHPARPTCISALFIELLERQFPIESIHQTLGLRTAKAYADQLAIHVNYLNRVLKKDTGLTALGRTGLPTDIGSVVAFLCTPEASWINAQRIEVSGGQML
ncbi:AraC family transcriptional regulator [Myroides odoratus]|uniref:AraC family transcriptional regulator n=1 Tax=Myroides odoratus TaxID=256 RepID=UPI0039AEEB1E